MSKPRIWISNAKPKAGEMVRVRALVERLRREHECALFAPGDAHDFLAPLYRGTDVRVERMDGNRRRAAETLGIGERTLYRKIKEYELDK